MSLRALPLTMALGCLATPACSSSEEAAAGPLAPISVDGGLVDVVVTHPDLPPLPGQAACTIETADSDSLASPHVPECTEVTYPSEPPTYGPHYPVWAAFRKYRGAVPEPYLVHDLEHGAIVLFYHCPDGCPDVLAALEEAYDAFPADPLCTPPAKARLVLVEDPKLDVPLALASFGHLYRATCIDAPGIAAWMAAHYARATENTCGDGLDFTAPDGGVIVPCQFPDAAPSDGPAMDAPGGG